MTKESTQANIGYFGKIPARGDFIKASDNSALIGVLDEWLAQSMDLLASDPRWKIIYDAVEPVHFAFIGPRRKRAIAGHIVASSDEAQRRFPFLAMSTMEIDEPAEFLPRCPLALARLWNSLQPLTADVLSSANPSNALQVLSTTMVELELNNSAYDAIFSDFLEMQTIGALDTMLAQAHFGGSVRQVMLALGLLLQPVMTSGSSRLEKSLVLPLPNDPLYRYLTASFWMRLITPFLLNADFELVVFFTKVPDGLSMVIGFSGASPRTLHAIMDPQIAEEHHIRFEDVSWVEDQIESDYRVKKLSSYLAQPNLSLKSARDSFREAFIGA